MLLVLAALAAALMLYRVDGREFVVITCFGRPVQIGDQPWRKDPGLYWKWPSPVESIYRFDRRLQVYLTPLVQYLTNDQKTIIVQCYVTWRIENPLEFFVSLADMSTAQQKLTDIVGAELGATVGDYDMSDLFLPPDDAGTVATTQAASGGAEAHEPAGQEGEQPAPPGTQTASSEAKVDEMESRMVANVNKNTGPDYGIVVEDIGICRLALSEENAQSVYDRMRAERAAIARGLRSEGMKQATEITAAAEKKKSDILAVAYRVAEIMKGKADAEATKTYAQAFQEDPEFYEFWKTLDAYEKILDKNTTVVLPLDSDLFKLLNRKGSSGK